MRLTTLSYKKQLCENIKIICKNSALLLRISKSNANLNKYEPHQKHMYNIGHNKSSTQQSPTKPMSINLRTKVINGLIK